MELGAQRVTASRTKDLVGLQDTYTIRLMYRQLRRALGEIGMKAQEKGMKVISGTEPGRLPPLVVLQMPLVPERASLPYLRQLT